MPRPTLRDLLDLPEHLGTQDYVLKLSQAINDPGATTKSYVVTEQLVACFDQALTLVHDALGLESGYTESKAAYLHGSFGAGKSHFMAMLYLLLSGDSRARSVAELAQVVSRHSDWTSGRNFLLVTYHMSDASTLEERLLGGYVDRIRELHPDAPPPPVYRSDALLEDARNLRSSVGDKAFFDLLNAGGTDSGWGALSGWDAPSFEYAANASHRDQEQQRLISDLAAKVFTSARRTADVIDIDDGLSLISKHAKALGYDAVILFLDEVMLWLASRTADEAAKEGPKLAKLVEGAKSDRPAPLISFLARQRALKELLGQGRIGAEQAKVEEVLEWWNQRFRTITLEDRNLPEIVQKRLLRRKDSRAPNDIKAEDLINAEFEKALRIPGNVLETLITRTSDREQFRKLYPFTPAFMEVLVGAAAALQRQRTGLRILSEILDRDAGRMHLGEIFAVGDLFSAMEAGTEPMSGKMQELFGYARAVWRRLRAQIEHDAGASFDDLHKLPVEKQTQMRAQQRIAGTLILAALVPNLESFRDLNGNRIAALNYGSIQTRIPGTEGAQVLATCRRWAGQGLVQLNDPGSATTTISVELTSVDVNAILDSASKAYESYGNIARTAGELLFEELGIKSEDNFETAFSFGWRGTKRSAYIRSFNIREASEDRLTPPPGSNDWLLVIDTPVYKNDNGPADHLRRLREFERQNPDGARTVAWVPAAVSERVRQDLGRLAILENLLSTRFDKLKEYTGHLSTIEREQARQILSAMQKELKVSVKSALAQAYGVGVIQPGNLDQSYPLSPADQFQSLEPEFRIQRPSGSTVDKGLEQLLHQALDWQFPGHPDFRSDEFKAESIGRKLIEKAYGYILEALRDPDRRKSLLQRQERLQLRALLEPMNLAQVTDQYLFPLDYWYTHFEKAHHDAGGGDLTVGKLRDYLDKPKPMGLDTDLQDLIILVYASSTNRSFRAAWGAAEPKLGSLKDDWQLIEEQLPSREAWETATKRADALFGVGASSLLLNASALANFGKQVQQKANDFLEPSRKLLGVLPEQNSNRYQTAKQSYDLLQRLTTAKTALDAVGVLEATTSGIKDDGIARSIKSAEAVAQELSSPAWGIVKTLRSITAEPYATLAKAILDSVDHAVRSDEYAAPLVQSLHKAVAETTDLLERVHKASAPAPAPQGPIRPPMTGQPPMTPGAAKLKRVVAEGSTTASSRQLDSIFQEIRSKLPKNGNAEVVLSWQVLAEQ
jgi:hypothetical protein